MNLLTLEVAYAVFQAEYKDSPCVQYVLTCVHKKLLEKCFQKQKQLFFFFQ